MGSEWRETPLGEVTENFDAVRIPVKQTDRRPGLYPYYGASGVVDHVDSFLFDGEYLLVAEDGENLRTRTTPVAFLANGKFWVNNHAHIVRGNSKANTRFLMYALTELDISGYLTGSTMPKLTQGNMNRIPVPLPPLPEQRAIAHILGTLDDKIELNRRMNETLEEMARALFKSWFVDFDPVRAKMEGRWRPGESLPGLPAEHYDLFPDRLVPSELGDIPEGWEVKQLGEITSLNPESWSRTNVPQEVEYVDLANTKWGVIEATQHYSWADAPSRAKRILRSGDTVLGTVRPGNGSYALIGGDGLTGSTGFAVLRPLDMRNRTLVYLAVTDTENIERLANRADGAAYPAIRPEVVGETAVVLPEPDHGVFDCFSERTGPMLDKIETNKKESRALAALQGTMLPKLVSGEISVGHLEPDFKADG